jgi:hypothetical protein
MLQLRFICITAFLIFAGNLQAQTPFTSDRAAQDKPAGSSFNWRTFELKLVQGPFKMTYSRKGLILQTNEGRFTSRIRWRIEPRLFNFDNDPTRVSQFETRPDDHFVMRRARFKVDGKMWGDVVNYNFEHDLVGNLVLNLFADISPVHRDWLQFRVGQWKSVFSTERAISSGSQQFVDRSIVNREFTVDRQFGVSIFGRFMEGSRADSQYAIEILNGSGRWGGWNDGSPMIVARYQWNFFGQEVDEAGSDLAMRTKPAAYLALNGMRNTSRFTRFSASGGGQLDGFTAGVKDQYGLTQLNGEFAFKYRGWSIQNENHWKRVDDRLTGTRTELRGTLAQIGYFPHAIWQPFPKSVEIGYRWAQVDPGTAVGADARRENTVVVNVFEEGHNNKFTLEASRLSMDRPGLSAISDWRYRAQWDVHF